MDWGCGLIDTSETQIVTAIQLPAKLDYELHYEWLLRYKCSVAQYLRSTIAVFYQLACMENWRQVFEEQMVQLSGNLFDKIHLIVPANSEEMEEINLVLGKNIKKKREAAGLTQAALGDLCDMERQNMYRIEKGNTSPSLQTLRLIAKALKLKVRDLLDFVQSITGAVYVSMSMKQLCNY